MKVEINFSDDKQPITIESEQSFVEFVEVLFSKDIYISIPLGSSGNKLAINTKHILYIWEIKE